MFGDVKQVNMFILGLILPCVFFFIPDLITGKSYCLEILLPAAVAWMLPNMPVRWVIQSLFNISLCYAVYWLIVGLFLPELKTLQRVMLMNEYLPWLSWWILTLMYVDRIGVIIFPETTNHLDGVEWWFLWLPPVLCLFFLIFIAV